MHAWSTQAVKQTILAAARAEHLEAELQLREEKDQMEAKLRKELAVFRERERETAEVELARARERELFAERETEREEISMERNIRLQEELQRTRVLLDSSERKRA